MTTVFGQVADTYDEVRPAYPGDIADTIASYAGSIDAAAEIGSGTGLGTAVLARLGVPLTCVEPDPRMAALLAVKFPGATVTVSTFEQWTPPPGGVALLGCAMAWHWLDPATRNQRAFDALRPGGTLAVFGHSYTFADPAHEQAITDAFTSCGIAGRSRPPGWFHDDIVASGLWADARREVLTRDVDFTTERYLQLHQTYATHLRRSPALQRQTLDALRDAIDGLGGTIRLRLPTTVALARRPA